MNMEQAAGRFTAKTGTVYLSGKPVTLTNRTPVPIKEREPKNG
jgi:hypothetical protein